MRINTKSGFYDGSKIVNIKDIEEDIKDLRGKEVYVFGQKTTLSEEKSFGTVDELDILRNLPEVVDFFEVDEKTNIDVWMSSRGWKMGSASNTCNYDNNIYGDINYANIVDASGEVVAVAIRHHRYGDLRGNYTDWAVFKATDEMDFYYALDELSCHFGAGGQEVDIQNNYANEELGIQKINYITLDFSWGSEYSIYISYVDLDGKQQSKEVWAERHYYENSEEVVNELKENKVI